MSAARAADMKHPPIPVNTPLLDGNEEKYLRECIQSGWISSEGPFVGRFEEEFAKRVGRQHGIAVTNGTAALEAAVVALGIGAGDEVIVPTFAIISCAAAILRAGAVPVGVESDAITWNMRVDQLDSLVTPRTKAIMVVHTYGLPVDMDPVLAFAARHDLWIIEDAAEMHGQTYRGKPCGSFGDISAFSFYPNKHVTTGEGGMLVVDDPALAARCRALRNLCFLPERRFVHEELGWNLRMTNLQAALGVAQLERLDEFVVRKRRMGALYQELLAGSTQFVQLPCKSTDYAQSIYWVFGLVLTDAVPFDAPKVMQLLAAKGIGTRPFFWSLHEQPVIRKMGYMLDERHPVAENMARRGFYLPSGLALKDSEIERCAAALQEVFRDAGL